MAASTPEFLRTPDERFERLAGLPFHSSLRRKPAGLRRPAHALPRRRTARRRPRVPVPARATHVELPVPADDSRVARLRRACRCARLFRLRALGQTRRRRLVHVHAAPRFAAGLRAGARPPQHHARLPGLGWHPWPDIADGRPAAFHASAGHEHGAGDRQAVARCRFRRLARVGQREPGPARRCADEARLSGTSRTTRRQPTTRHSRTSGSRQASAVFRISCAITRMRTARKRRAPQRAGGATNGRARRSWPSACRTP